MTFPFTRTSEQSLVMMLLVCYSCFFLNFLKTVSRRVSRGELDLGEDGGATVGVLEERPDQTFDLLGTGMKARKEKLILSFKTKSERDDSHCPSTRV